MPKGSGYNSQGNHYNTPGGTNSSSGSSYHCEFRAFDQFVLGWHVISRFSTCGFLDTPKHKPSRLAWDLRGASSIACSLSVWTCVASAFRCLYYLFDFRLQSIHRHLTLFILLDLSLTARPIRIPRHWGQQTPTPTGAIITPTTTARPTTTVVRGPAPTLPPAATPRIPTEAPARSKASFTFQEEELCR